MAIKDTNKIINYIYTDIAQPISDFLEYVPSIIPDSEDDEKTLSIALDMVQQLQKTFRDSESLSELDKVIDVRAMIDDYNNGQFNTIVQYSQDGYDLIDSIRSGYMLPEE